MKIVRFSPLRDRQLPTCQMIGSGGGYRSSRGRPVSQYADALAYGDRHRVAIYAECGGLMYLWPSP